VVDGQALLDRLRLVVVALDESRAVLVADALVLRGVELHVVHVLVLHALAPSREAPDHLVVADLDQQHRGEQPSAAVERALEHLGLADRAREAVEQEAVVGLAGVEPLLDHPADKVVGHELALVDVLLRFAAELRFRLDRGAQDDPGRVVGQAEVGNEALCLGALTGPGRTEQDQVQLAHLRKPS
jgi:hypothetical protein